MIIKLKKEIEIVRQYICAPFQAAGEEYMMVEEVEFFIPSIEKNLNPTDLTIDCLVLGWSSSFNEFNKFLEGNIGHEGHRKIVCEPHATHRLCV